MLFQSHNNFLLGHPNISLSVLLTSEHINTVFSHISKPLPEADQPMAETEPRPDVRISAFYQKKSISPMAEVEISPIYFEWNFRCYYLQIH